MEGIFEWGASLVISVISISGYLGIAGLMALESANIPVPSEIIMPFSGYLAFQKEFSFLWVVFWGAIGNLLGSLLSYYLGYFGGRPFLQKYGKFFLIHAKELEIGERFFQRYGSLAVFVGRLLPVVRTFISLPAGIAKMSLGKFSLYTFMGSFLWSWALTYIGFKTGENWNFLAPYFRQFDWAIGILLVLGVLWWIKRRA